MLNFELITPERTLFQLKADQVTLPTTMGEVTILSNHVPLVAELAAGILHIKSNGDEEEVAVAGGFVQIDEEGTVRVLSRFAELGDELNLAAIEEAKERAKKVMEEAIRTNDESFAHAAAALEREFARERLAIRIKRRGHAPKIANRIISRVD